MSTSNPRIPRLGINIDHVATLRQARGEDYPSVVEAANVSLSHGADQITIHLREDRRHIQDTDVEAVSLVTKKFGKPLNLEMGCDREIIDIAKTVSPDWVCLVPEKREEKTTEGGLALENDETFDKIKSTCEEIKKDLPATKISLFLEAKPEVLQKSLELQVDAVEIHTGDFARAVLNGDDLGPFYEQFEKAKEILEKGGLGCHAGHGLNSESTELLVKKKLFQEYNIGHWVICQAVFDSLETVVRRLKNIMEACS